MHHGGSGASDFRLFAVSAVGEAFGFETLAE